MNQKRIYVSKYDSIFQLLDFIWVKKDIFSGVVCRRKAAAAIMTAELLRRDVNFNSVRFHGARNWLYESYQMQLTILPAPVTRNYS